MKKRIREEYIVVKEVEIMLGRRSVEKDLLEEQRLLFFVICKGQKEKKHFSSDISSWLTAVNSTPF